MKIYSLHREQLLPVSISDAWDFFSSAGNLPKITPRDMDFRIVSAPDDTPIRNGMLISYTLRPLFSIPVKWTTEIKDVQAPDMFIDTQLHGPYKLWEHKHTFTAVENGVLMTDDVRYALPLGIIGQVAHSLFVKKKLQQIFDFRATTLGELFKRKKAA